MNNSKKVWFVPFIICLWAIHAVVCTRAFPAEDCPTPRSVIDNRPSRVELNEEDGNYRLVRNGEPYLIRGAGGDGDLKLLLDSGGNSLRTWGTDRAGVLLDEAHALGLSVTVGIWLGHERHGFDYNKSDQVVEQFERAREVILQLRDHPALTDVGHWQ